MIFICYSHEDASWRDELLTMAAPLEKTGRKFFADLDIVAGSDWRAAIQNALDRTSVAVLLVSRHFLKSKFIMERELPYFLAARNAGSAARRPSQGRVFTSSLSLLRRPFQTKKGKPNNPLPKYRTIADGLRVIRG